MGKTSAWWPSCLVAAHLSTQSHFAPATAKYFRVTFKRTPPPPIPDWAAGIDPASFGITLPPPPRTFEIAELVLHPGPRVNHFEEKAAFVPEPRSLRFRNSSCRRK